MQLRKGPLTTAEWVVMDAIWGREPQVLAEIIESIGSKVDWNYQTYASYLNVLCEKGFIGFKKRGRNKFYYPMVDKDECIEAESNSILQKLNGEGTEKLLLHMLKKVSLSEAAQEKLRNLIEELDESE